MASEVEEVRLLLSRHRDQIKRELTETKLVSILASKSVLTGSDQLSVNNECDLDKKCTILIDFVSINGFEKFKEFCYAIETECPTLIEDLINDRLKYDIDCIKDVSAITKDIDNNKDININKDVSQNGRDTIDSNRSQRSTSYCGSGSVNHTPVVTTSRRSSINIPQQNAVPSTIPDGDDTIKKPINKNNYSPPIYVNKNSTSTYDDINLNQNTYSSLFCYQSVTSSPSLKKREKVKHRFSDAGSWGRSKKDKKDRRPYHSMNETIEVLADPVIEDDFFGDRTSWEYHTVSVTRVPGYGFGIAVSGGRDNPHFANGDPSIAVSDVLKGGPAEDRLQVNDRIISVNGVSLENVEYATAVQVLRDSGNTVTLVIKRRVSNINLLSSPSHQHSHSLVSSTGLGGAGIPAQQTVKLVLSKPSKKDDFGIVLGCRLFVKEISSKARDQLALNGYSLHEGDIVTRIHNTNTNDQMSLKEAKKIIDGCKERLNMVVLRDATNNAATSSGMQSPVYSHAAQVSNCSNNIEDSFLAGGGGSSYSAQNLYVQPPTRPAAMSTLLDDKSNLTPRGRSRNPLMDVSLLQLDRPSTPQTSTANVRNRIDEPPRPPPPRGEDFYSSRRQLYEEDPLHRSKQSAEPRFISFQKEGSVGIRLTGGNEAGIFVTAVQPGSPASLQGLTPGDKILKVNDMDMNGVTREEAVLFLLSLQDRIDLIVQHCKEEYDNVVANQRGDSFHIKTHFHCDNPSKGEMSFKAGDIFRVVDTLHNGVVGSWQVLRIGRGHQEMQRGVIPNKSRAEELATAQFNATKKEMNASESRTSFFRRRRSTHRRSKSLSRENWDDVVFSDSISKFPAYERVVLRHPGFVRPVVLFGPVADIARDRLTKDFPDKFTAPLQDNDKANGKCAIVRLSNIRDIMDRGKHALLDITPNAVDRLNYAQFYPIVIFMKTETKHMIKQLRAGIPKAAHKSSKKLFEQCQKLDKVWSHIFSNAIVMNDVDTWYRKLRDGIDQLQSGAVWMSETKPVESLSDDFLFPMQTSRLSYASSPESDLELSPGPSASLSLGNLPQLVKSSSDPSIATNQDNLERDREMINMGEGMPPPYTNPFDHSTAHLRRATVDNKYGFSNENADASNPLVNGQPYYGTVPELPPRIDRASKPPGGHLSPSSPNAPTTPVSRNHSVGTFGRSVQERLFGKTNESGDPQDDYATRTALLNSPDKRTSAGNSLDRNPQNSSLDRTPRAKSVGNQNNGSYDSVSSYDSCNTTQISMQNLRLGPNAPDDLKSVPNVNSRIQASKSLNDPTLSPHQNNFHGLAADPHLIANRSSLHEHSKSLSGINGKNTHNSPNRPPYVADPHGRSSGINAHDPRPPGISIPQRPSNLGLDSTPPRKQHSVVETKTDYGKYSRNNSASQADYARTPKITPQTISSPANGANGVPPFKPVPPPKPKNYRPPVQGGQMNSAQWENGQESTSPRSPNGFFYPPPSQSHYHHSQGNGPPPPLPAGGHHPPPPPMHNYNQYAGGNANYSSGTGNGGNNHSAHYAAGMNGGYSGNNHSYGGQYNNHRSPGMGNLPPQHHPAERHALDLAGSREQRGSAFELYRKPQIGGNAMVGHHHNISHMEPQHHHHQQQQPQHYNYTSAQLANELNERHLQQYYGSDSTPPPLPPPKTKKTFLKSPLVALKRVFLKSTKPLRRQNSLLESEQNKPIRPILRRQHSMLERSTYDAQMMMMATPEMSHRQYASNYDGQNAHMQRYVARHEPFSPKDSHSTYQNLETEAIYGNCGSSNFYEHQQQENMYANRSLIEFERRAASQPPNFGGGTGGGRIIRRHSMADRSNGASQDRRPIIRRSGRDRTGDQQQQPQREEIYQTRSGAYMMDNPAVRHDENYGSNGRNIRHNRRSEDDPIYQSRKEMHYDHLYQSKREMQQRIHQGRLEVERATSESPVYVSRRDAATPSSSASENIDASRDPVYQSRRELKEKGFRTRTQLRDHIYQSRQDAMKSMAEPIYVSKREFKNEPIYESRELDLNLPPLNITQPEINESNVNNESIERVEEHLTIIDNERIKDQPKDPNISYADEEDDDSDEDDDEDDEETIKNQSDFQKGEQVTENIAIPMSPRSIRDSYHISNMIKRTAPPDVPQPLQQLNGGAGGPSNVPAHNVHASRTSIETQYTSSQSCASLPTGPPNAQSTPYASEVQLPPIREQTTCRGVFDENGGTLSDNVWNVSISIPRGAIKPGIQQEIYFTVTDPRLSQTVGGPPLDMENGETMLSPLVMCGPQGLEFLVPVTLNIPHCAGRTASLGLALKATDSEKDLQTNWDNIELPSNAAAHTVSVKVDHF